MWHSTSEHDEFGFEVLRPDENGDSQIIQCTVVFDQDKIFVEGPTYFHYLFTDSIKGAPNSYDFKDEYLIARYDDFYVQLKIEPGEGLVADMWDNDDDTSSPIEEAPIWWEDL
jgi:hypothetical protein